MSAEEPSFVCQTFTRIMEQNSDTSYAVATVGVLTEVLKRSQSTTMMGAQGELREAYKELQKLHTNITIKSGFQLFILFVTRSFEENPDFNECKRVLIERGEKFMEMTQKARTRISHLGNPFIRDNIRILVHGHSKVVVQLLSYAAACHKRFHVLVTESRPDNAGWHMLNTLAKHNVPAELITDTAVGFYMETIDLVLVGAEAVMENGGIINKIGTFQIAMAAKEFNKPMYVTAESYKFVRAYPLNQRDIPSGAQRFVDLNPSSAEIPCPSHFVNPLNDYTPPKFIRLLITDLGVLTPSVVSDELIKLYN